MNSNIIYKLKFTSYIYLFILVGTLLFTSFTGDYKTQKNGLILNLEFGTSSVLLNKEIVKMVANGEIIMSIKDSDTIFYRMLELGKYSNKTEVYFNGDALNSGPLRFYTYSLSDLPYKKSGNDTIGGNGYDFRYNSILLKSELENIKSYLDKQFGMGGFNKTQKIPFWVTKW